MMELVGLTLLSYPRESARPNAFSVVTEAPVAHHYNHRRRYPAIDGPPLAALRI